MSAAPTFAAADKAAGPSTASGGVRKYGVVLEPGSSRPAGGGVIRGGTRRACSEQIVSMLAYAASVMGHGSP